MIKNLYKYSFVVLMTLIFASCTTDNNPENLFDKTPTARLNEQVQELYSLLQSSPNGWKMTYFTDDPEYTNTAQQLGGWTFIYKFTDDKKVTMISDYSSQTLVPNESEYEIQLGSTVKLVFVTKNYIHLLSDAANYPTSALEGKGYKGDFEFLYYGKDDEDLIFKSNRAHIKIRFQKATAQDWDKMDDARANLDHLSSGMVLKINQNSQTTSYKINYNTAARFAQNATADSLSFGIAPTPEGITIKPAISVGGEQATDFVYNATDEIFISTLASGATVTLSALQSVYLFVYEGDFTTQNVSWLLPKSSPDFINNVWAPTSTNIAGIGYTFAGIFIGPKAITYYLIGPSGNEFQIAHNVTYSIDEVNNRFILQDAGWASPGEQAVVEPLAQPFETLLLDPQGFTIERSGVLFGYPAFTITSYANPNIKIFVLGGF